MYTWINRRIGGGMRGLELALLAFFLVVPTLMQAAETLPIVADGVAKVVVVRNTEGGAVVSLAVTELLDHVEAMTGVRLPVVDAKTWDRSSGQAAIIVGRGTLLDEIGVELGELPWEGYRILSLPSRRLLVLAGRDQGTPMGTAHPRNRLQEFGTLYAVYDVLEQWGVRWLFQGSRGTVIPQLATLDVPLIDRVEGPDFRRRNLWTSEEEPRDKLKDTASTQHAARLWALRCRAGNSMNEYATGHHTPTWWSLWGETHPEYLGLFRGQRGWSKRPEQSKLCPSNPDVARAVADRAIAAFHNGSRSYSICEQDGSPGFCNCAECRALDVPLPGEIPYTEQDYGTPNVTSLTDRYIVFWNRVAEYVDAAFPDDPDRYLGVYLYTFASDLPRKGQRLHPRLRAVYVNNGQIEPTELRRRIAGWSQLTPHPLALYVPPMFGAWPMWDYGGLSFPVLTLGNVHKGIQFCREQGVAGMQNFDSFTRTVPGGHGLITYALTRWLWDADRTPDDILTDFTQHAFGSAAALMRAYFRALEQQQNRFPSPFVPRENVGFEKWLAHQLSVFTPEFVEKLRGILEEATGQALTSSDRDRIFIFRQNLDFTAAQVELERRWITCSKSADDDAKKKSLLEVVTAYETCEQRYASLWPENKPERPLFQRGAAAKAVAEYRSQGAAQN